MGQELTPTDTAIALRMIARQMCEELYELGFVKHGYWVVTETRLGAGDDPDQVAYLFKMYHPTKADHFLHFEESPVWPEVIPKYSGASYRRATGSKLVKAVKVLRRELHKSKRMQAKALKQQRVLLAKSLPQPFLIQPKSKLRRAASAMWWIAWGSALAWAAMRPEVVMSAVRSVL